MRRTWRDVRCQLVMLCGLPVLLKPSVTLDHGTAADLPANAYLMQPVCLRSAQGM
jgi:hypothetical protein